MSHLSNDQFPNHTHPKKVSNNGLSITSIEQQDTNTGIHCDSNFTNIQAANGFAGVGTKQLNNEFVRKIYGILKRGDYPDIVCWTDDGDNFVVLDTGKFTSTILPNHFKHSNFASFVRQLNKYDFHKVKRTQEERWKSQYGELSWEFNHPYFKKGQEDLLDNIRRKTTTQKKVIVDDNTLFLKSGDGSQSIIEKDTAMHMILNNTVNTDTFNQFKKRVDILQKELDLAKKQKEDTKLEFDKINSKYYTVLESLLTFKTVNDSLVNNFNILCGVLSDQGIEIPQSLQYNTNKKDMELQQESTSPSLTSNTSTTINPEILQGDHINKTSTTALLLPTKAPTSKSDEFNDDNILRKGFHVLLVEDDEVSIQLCSKFLRKYGCTVQVVTDGLAAISTLEKYRFDIVLMDIVMPNLDGATATSIIRNFDNQTPIIAMTGSIGHQDLITYLQHGMNDILAKPFSKKDLYSMLTRYLKDRIPLSEQHHHIQTNQPYDNNSQWSAKDGGSNPGNGLSVIMEDGHSTKKQRI